MTTTQNGAGATAATTIPAAPAAPVAPVAPVTPVAPVQQERASGSRLGSAELPRAGSRGGGSGPAPMRNNNYALVQLVLFWAGAVLLPTGLIVIILGYYGASHTPYEYDQLSYLVSGGLFGLGLTFAGGFLYFGAWLARMTNDNRDSAKRLADTLLVLADITSRNASLSDQGVDLGALPVVAGDGTTTHRRDCALIAHREDLHPASESRATLTACRVCRPA